MTVRATPRPPAGSAARAAGMRARRRRPSRRQRLARTLLTAALGLLGIVLVWIGVPAGWAGGDGPGDLSGIAQPDAPSWDGPQPGHGVDISFPQCGRTLRDMAEGFVIVGLDGGMPDRPNPCFRQQWQFAQRQAGVGVYVNTAYLGGTGPRAVGRRAAEEDLRALAGHGIAPGTPVWLDVELPEVWKGTPDEHRIVIGEHLRVLAQAGHPVGVYSAPALWQEITGGADLGVPTWVGIGPASAERAAATCERTSFGGRAPAIVQRIGRGSDGRPLDRNLPCPGVDLTGLVRPA